MFTVVTSDGEWNEGSNWEALIFSAHHKLTYLIIIVDANGIQGFGSTEDVAGLAPLAQKFAAFGFDTLEIDGHDPAAIDAALALPSAQPRACK